MAIRCFTILNFIFKFFPIESIVITNFMELSPYWETASYTATKKFPKNLRNPNVYYRVHKSPPRAKLIQSIPTYPISLRSLLCGPCRGYKRKTSSSVLVHTPDKKPILSLERMLHKNYDHKGSVEKQNLWSWASRVFDANTNCLAVNFQWQSNFVSDFNFLERVQSVEMMWVSEESWFWVTEFSCWVDVS
jgi:hypothetical protein